MRQRIKKFVDKDRGTQDGPYQYTDVSYKPSTSTLDSEWREKARRLQERRWQLIERLPL